MKLKALLVAGAVCLASAVNSSAQAVFSANTVGFVNKTIPSGFSLISNPVIAADNSIAALFADAPGGFKVFKFDPGQGTFSTITKGLFGWGSDAQSTTLVPGEGAFISNPGAEFTITFTGEVMQGPQSNMEIGAGFSIVSSVVAQGGTLQTDLGFPSAENDQVFQFNVGTQAYETYNFTDFNDALQSPVWFPSEPSVGVGESFFVNKASTVSWNRNFDPNGGQ